MPAKQHGRAGKARRPRLGESAFSDVANDAKAHPAMRKLAGLAGRRGLSLRELARRVEREPESVMRSFYAAAPRLNSVEELGAAMGLSKRLARALLSMLTDHDRWDLCFQVSAEVFDRAAMFADPPALVPALHRRLLSCPESQQRKALEAFEIARSGLNDDEELRETAPAPALISLCRELNFDLRPFVASKELLSARTLEAAAAYTWLLESLPISQVDEDRLEKIVARYGVRPSRLVYQGALARAKGEFRRMIGDEFTYGDAITLAMLDVTGEIG